MSRSFKKIPVYHTKSDRWLKRQWVTNWRHHANRKLHTMIDLESYQDIAIDQINYENSLFLFRDIYFLYESRGSLKKDLENIPDFIPGYWARCYYKVRTANLKKEYKRIVYKHWIK